MMFPVMVASISPLIDVDEEEVGGHAGIGKLKDRLPGVAEVAVNPGQLPPGPAGGELGKNWEAPGDTANAWSR